MLGGILNFNPMRPDENSITLPRAESNVISNKDNDEEKNYESIVNEKTSIINKKKPKKREFNSNLNETKTEEPKSTNPFGQQSIPFGGSKKEENNVILESKKSETLMADYIEPVKTVTVAVERKITFEDIPKIRTSLKTNESEVHVIMAKPKTGLFDFEDTDSLKTSTIKPESKPSIASKTNTTAANKKISFLFDEE